MQLAQNLVRTLREGLRRSPDASAGDALRHAIERTFPVSAIAVIRWDRKSRGPHANAWQAVRDAQSALDKFQEVLGAMSASSAAARLGPLNLVHDRPRVAQEIAEAATALAEAIPVAHRKEAAKQGFSGRYLRQRWSRFAYCGVCWRLAPAGGRRPPLCHAHHVPPRPTGDRARRPTTQITRYYKLSRDLRAAQRDLMTLLATDGGPLEPLLQLRRTALDQNYFPDAIDEASFQQLLRGDLNAARFSCKCPTDLSPILERLVHVGQFLDDAKAMPDDIDRIVQTLDPLELDPYGIHSAAHRAIALNTRFIAPMLTRADVFLEVRSSRRARHGGSRRRHTLATPS